MGNDYKSKVPFELRKQESERIKEQYPDRLPVVVEKNVTCKSLPNIDKKKFLVPKDLTIAQFLYVVRKRLNIDSTQAIFLFTKDNTLPTGSQEVQSIYDELKDEDGFLYLFYSAESTFGNF
jgi:GABA(A) receptor-associated protein